MVRSFGPLAAEEKREEIGRGPRRCVRCWSGVGWIGDSVGVEEEEG